MGGLEIYPYPIEGQLTVPGYAPTLGMPTNEELIRGEVTEGRMDEETAEANIASLGELAIRARQTDRMIAEE